MRNRLPDTFEVIRVVQVGNSSHFQSWIHSCLPFQRQHMGKEEWVRISQLLFFFVQNQRPTKCVPLSKQAVNVLHQTNHLSSCQLRVVSSLGRGELSHFVLKPTSRFRNVPAINISNKDMNKDFGGGGNSRVIQGFFPRKKVGFYFGYLQVHIPSYECWSSEHCGF